MYNNVLFHSEDVLKTQFFISILSCFKVIRRNGDVFAIKCWFTGTNKKVPDPTGFDESSQFTQSHKETIHKLVLICAVLSHISTLWGGGIRENFNRQFYKLLGRKPQVIIVVLWGCWFKHWGKNRTNRQQEGETLVAQGVQDLLAAHLEKLKQVLGDKLY
jgi:hypothetical protein